MLEHAEVEVAQVYETAVQGMPTTKPWPGTHKNVHIWYLLVTGVQVGWNENPATGWSFPVLAPAGKARRGA